MDTTTIEIKKSQVEELDSIATGSYKEKLQVLIDSYEQSNITESDVRRIAREEINDMVTFKALE
jgi:hypothetical protein